MKMSDESLVYIKGELRPASSANIAIYDAAVVLGATVTDLARTFHGELYRLADHIQRFYRSCRYARIQPQIEPEATMNICRQLVTHNRSLVGAGAELAVVLFISPGEFAVYAGAAGMAGEQEPTFCIHTFPLPFSLWAPYFAEGVHVVTPSVRQVPPVCVDPKIKCRSRMHWWLADQETHLVDPKAVSLCLDLDGNITETSGANFMMVRDGTVFSPSPRSILRGISLETVAEICDELAIPFVERDFQVYDVINADEAFLTTTPYCMAPVTRINGLPIGSGASGPIFARLIAAWSERVGLDIVGQVRGEL